ncbi:MAG TPA: hypothetical protein VGI39_36685 [Polyangiaceae bacterium]
MQARVLFTMACLLGAACGSSSSGPATEPANPCATKGASYLETFTEQFGNCGPLAAQTIDVSATGTVTTPIKVTCASASLSGCAAHNSDCTFSNQGNDFTESFDVTFAADGSSATGSLTITGKGNAGMCTSTYKIVMVRQ